MKEWSRLKKAAVITAVGIFGLGGIGALTDNQSSVVNPPPTPEPTPLVQGQNTITQPTAQPAPQPEPTPAPTPLPTPEPSVTPPAASSSCDSNYSGGCVPIASDVDCGGGSGNGPAYFYGTATVVGVDIYGLDRDGDGIACE